jgi:hypothetical protein
MLMIIATPGSFEKNSTNGIIPATNNNPATTITTFSNRSFTSSSFSSCVA